MSVRSPRAVQEFVDAFVDVLAASAKGYFSSTQIFACHEDGITTTVPRPETSGNKSKGFS